MMYNRNKAEEMMMNNIEVAVNKIAEGVDALQQHGIDIKSIHVGSPDEQFGMGVTPQIPQKTPNYKSVLPVYPDGSVHPYPAELAKAFHNLEPYPNERIANTSKAGQCNCPNPFMGVIPQIPQKTPNYKSVRDILPVYPDGSVYSPFPAELSEEVINALSAIEEGMRKAERPKEFVVPATIHKDYIGTPDQKFISFNAPTTTFNGILSSLNELGDIAPIMNPLELRRIFCARCVAILKQIIITSFNMNQNCHGDTLCQLSEDPSDCTYPVYVTDDTVRREVRDMFYTRETLDILLQLVDSDFAFEFYLADGMFATNDSTLNMAFLMISKIYEQCLNRVDSSHDVVCLNNFIEMLTDKIPLAFINLRRELMEIYKLKERSVGYTEY